MRTIHDLNDPTSIPEGIQGDGEFRDDIEWTLTEAAAYFNCSYDTIRREVSLLLKYKAEGFSGERDPEERLDKVQLESIRTLRQLRARKYRGKQLVKKLIG